MRLTGVPENAVYDRGGYDTDKNSGPGPEQNQPRGQKKSGLGAGKDPAQGPDKNPAWGPGKIRPRGLKNAAPGPRKIIEGVNSKAEKNCSGLEQTKLGPETNSSPGWKKSLILCAWNP